MTISNQSSVLKMLQNVASFILAIVAAFFPKCAFCWAAYASILSAMGFSTIVFSQIQWLYPMLMVLLVFNIYSLWVIAKQRNAYLSFYLNLIGVSVLILQRFAFSEPSLIYVGILIIASASLNNYFGGYLVCKLKNTKS